MKKVLEQALDRTDPANRLVRTVVAQVPFVDSITDLIDSKMAWTAYEWYTEPFAC